MAVGSAASARKVRNLKNLEGARLAKRAVAEAGPAMQRIRLAGDGEKSALGLCCCTRANRAGWIAKHDLFVASDGRAYALVDTRTEVFFMDAITGALIALDDGVHQTNEAKRVRGFRRDHTKAAEILLRAFRDEEQGEGCAA